MIRFFGKQACSGCIELKPKVQAAAAAAGVDFEYVDLDTDAGQAIYDNYPSLPFSLPVVLVEGGSRTDIWEDDAVWFTQEQVTARLAQSIELVNAPLNNPPSDIQKLGGALAPLFGFGAALWFISKIL